MADGKTWKQRWLGGDSRLEILHKLFTMATFAFGVWAYVHSVKPVFDKENELQALQQQVEQLSGEVVQRRNEVDQLKNERWLLQQDLEINQELLAANDEGLVFWYLAEIRRFVEEEAQSQAQAGAPFDVRQSSLAYADWVLKRPGSPTPQKKAAEFFRRFVVRNVRPREADVSQLRLLLDAYDREGWREAAAP